MATNYSRGADFERRTAKNMESFGYVTVRSAGSHSPADIIALRGGDAVAIQCKRDGRLDPDEWNEFWEWCQTGGAVPILAKAGKNGRGIIYAKLTSRKDGRGRQPLAPWEPQRKEGNANVS